MSGIEMTREEAQKIIHEVGQKSMVDKEFRQRLLDNPTEVLEEITGKKLPGIKLDVIESKPDVDYTFVLPPMAKGDISDAELDQLAAGSCHSDYSWSNGP